MKTRFVGPTLALISVLLAACSTGPEARIQEKSTVFAALSPEQQQAVKGGVIAVGFTPDMVYMALGKASSVQTTSEGETWTYRNYYPSEAVSDMGVYRKPSAKGGLRQSSSLSQWSDNTLPSEAGSRDAMIETPSHGPSRPGGGGAPDVPTLTLEVFFRDGKVFSFRATR